jgi:hypothetical protein
MFRLLLTSLAHAYSHNSLLAMTQQASPHELVQYVRDAERAGLSVNQIGKNAVQAGWAKPTIEQALDLVVKAQKPQTEASKTTAERAGHARPWVSLCGDGFAGRTIVESLMSGDLSSELASKVPAH